MVVTITKETAAINLLNIPRDTLFYIPIKEKSAHAHVFGGINSTTDAVVFFRYSYSLLILNLISIHS